jgi:hypothetical protein
MPNSCGAIPDQPSAFLIKVPPFLPMNFRNSFSPMALFQVQSPFRIHRPIQCLNKSIKSLATWFAQVISLTPFGLTYSLQLLLQSVEHSTLPSKPLLVNLCLVAISSWMPHFQPIGLQLSALNSVRPNLTTRAKTSHVLHIIMQ